LCAGFARFFTAANTPKHRRSGVGRRSRHDATRLPHQLTAGFGFQSYSTGPNFPVLAERRSSQYLSAVRRTVGHGVRPYAALAAHPAIARRLAGVVPPAPEIGLELEDIVGPREPMANLVRVLAEPREAPVRVVVRGRRGAGRRTIAAVLAAQAGRALVVVETGEFLP